MLKAFRLILISAICAICSQAVAQNKADVIAIGGSVTEIVYALGQEHRLIARDSTSTFPEPANALPDVGYMRALSPEGVLSLDPGMILAEEGAGPQETIDVLAAASVPFVVVPDVYTGDGIVEKIKTVGEALGVTESADALAEQVTLDLKNTAAAVARRTAEPKRVLFVLSTRGGRIMASGVDTAAHGIIKMAGGVNAIDSFSGYKPLSDEAVTSAAPDVILMMDRGDHSVADEDLFSLPAIVTTPAAETRSVVRMNGLYLLGFGPRTAQAASDLNRYLYGNS